LLTDGCPGLREPVPVLVVLLVLVLMDVASTYLLLGKYPVELELNPVLRQLLAIDKRLVFAWIPVEYLGLLSLFYINKYVRMKLGVKKKLEYAVVLLLLVTVASNIIGLLQPH
jgi:hypothetical protein